MQPYPAMEEDPSSPDGPELAASAEEERAGTLRTYDCAFCKRGFSNAQALGGHMNIHRKDRAKLRQPSYSQVAPAEIPKQAVSSRHPPPPDAASSMARRRALFSDPRGCVFMWPRMIAREYGNTMGRVDHEGLRQLPLFIERPSHRDAGRPSGGFALERMEGGHASAELDLELRLGPHPPRGAPVLREYV